MLVNHFYLYQRHISSVGLHAFWVLYGCKLQLVRLACGLQFVAATIVGHSLKHSWLKIYVVESVQVAVALLAFSQTFAVKLKLYLIACRYHIYGLLYALVVVPVAYDIGLCGFGLYPSVPHNLMHVESILRNSHSIGNATHAIIRLSAMMGIGVREHNFYASR